MGGLVNGGADTEEIADGVDFAERDAGLCHAERAGIHAEEDGLFSGIKKLGEEGLVRGCGVLEGIVDGGDGRVETQGVAVLGELAGAENEGMGDGGRWHGTRRSGQRGVLSTKGIWRNAAQRRMA